MNKQGMTLSSWTEILILTILFVGAFFVITSSMNSQYNRNYDASFDSGFVQDSQDINGNITQLQRTIERSVNNETASFSTFGFLVLASGYDVLKSSMTLIWGVIGGGWIVKSVELTKLPTSFGYALQTIYLLGVGFILFRIIFRGRV